MPAEDLYGAVGEHQSHLVGEIPGQARGARGVALFIEQAGRFPDHQPRGVEVHEHLRTARRYTAREPSV